MAYLENNTAKISNIGDIVGRIAGRNYQQRADRSNKIYDAFKTGAGTYINQKNILDQRQAAKDEADKQRQFQAEQGQRQRAFDWEKMNKEIASDKELQKMAVDREMALARLNEALKESYADKTGQSNPDAVAKAYSAVMDYALSEPENPWNGTSWRPLTWTTDREKTVLEKIDAALPSGPIGDQVRQMALKALKDFEYDKQQEDTADSGVSWWKRHFGAQDVPTEVESREIGDKYFPSR